jgi:hypothetical protein
MSVIDHYIGFEEKRHCFHRKLVKVTENSDNYICQFFKGWQGRIGKPRRQLKQGANFSI